MTACPIGSYSFAFSAVLHVSATHTRTLTHSSVRCLFIFFPHLQAQSSVFWIEFFAAAKQRLPTAFALTVRWPPIVNKYCIQSSSHRHDRCTTCSNIALYFRRNLEC